MSGAFAKQLEEKLISETRPIIHLEALNREIDKLTAIHNSAAASRRVDLDKQGTRLWNLTPNLRSKDGNGEILCCSSYPSCSYFSTRTYQRSTCFRLPPPQLRTTMLASPDHLE